MDPLSQGVLGAAAPKSVAPPEHARIAALFGFLAGMAPDLDVFIRSSTDPLLFLEYHRQFTHALVFIPVGGLLCGWLLHLLFGKSRGLSLRRSNFLLHTGLCDPRATGCLHHLWHAAVLAVQRHAHRLEYCVGR